MLTAILLFLIGAGISVHTVHTIINGNPEYAYSAFGVFAIFASLSIIIERKKRKDFIKWLIINRKKVQGLGEEYHGQQISNRTELRVFHLAFSVIAFSFRVPSRLFIQPAGFCSVRIIYSITSAFCGWWGIPFGPIYTLQALYLNLRGGERLQVWQIYHDIDNKELQKKKKIPFLSMELTGTHKLGIGVIAVMLLMLLFAYIVQ